MARMKRTPFRKLKKTRVLKSDIEGRKAHRWRPGTGALREIKRMQKRTDLLIQCEPFYRVVREMANDYREGTRFAADALDALQEGAEAYITKLLTEAYKLTMLEKMQTIMVRHLHAALRIKV